MSDRVYHSDLSCYMYVSLLCYVCFVSLCEVICPNLFILSPIRCIIMIDSQQFFLYHLTTTPIVWCDRWLHSSLWPILCKKKVIIFSLIFFSISKEYQY